MDPRQPCRRSLNGSFGSNFGGQGGQQPGSPAGSSGSPQYPFSNGSGRDGSPNSSYRSSDVSSCNSSWPSNISGSSESANGDVHAGPWPELYGNYPDYRVPNGSNLAVGANVGGGYVGGPQSPVLNSAQGRMFAPVQNGEGGCGCGGQQNPFGGSGGMFAPAQNGSGGGGGQQNSFGSSNGSGGMFAPGQNGSLGSGGGGGQQNPFGNFDGSPISGGMFSSGQSGGGYGGQPNPYGTGLPAPGGRPFNVNSPNGGLNNNLADGCPTIKVFNEVPPFACVAGAPQDQLHTPPGQIFGSFNSTPPSRQAYNSPQRYSGGWSNSTSSPPRRNYVPLADLPQRLIQDPNIPPVCPIRPRAPFPFSQGFPSPIRHSPQSQMGHFFPSPSPSARSPPQFAQDPQGCPQPNQGVPMFDNSDQVNNLYAEQLLQEYDVIPDNPCIAESRQGAQRRRNRFFC